MKVQWTPDLATGVEEVDAQHRELFTRVDLLLEACRRGQGKDQVASTMGFLQSYVREHFGAEERFMVQHGYVGHGVHRQQHHRFLADLGVLAERLQAEGTSLTLLLDLNRMVVEWLREHIRGADVELGTFLRRVR